MQVFDPAFVNVGDNCGNDTAPSPLAGLQSSHLLLAQGLAANFNAGFPMTRADIINRYDPAATSLFCTGDNAFTATTEGNGVLPWTTYRVLGPDDTPADPTNNPPVAGCPAIDFPGTAGNLDTLLRSTTPIAGAPDTLVKYFRQWYSICTVSNPTEGAYFLQVQTATKANGSAAPAGGGHNRFSIRAGLGGSYVTGNVKVSGQDKMSIYANAEGAKPTFYLARVLPGAKGRVLVLSFFDIGDAADDRHPQQSAGPAAARRNNACGTNHELGRLHLHAAARCHYRSTVGGVHPDTRRGNVHDHAGHLGALRPPVGAGADSHTRRLHVRVPRPARLLVQDPLRFQVTPSPTPPHGRRTSKATPYA